VTRSIGTSPAPADARRGPRRRLPVAMAFLLLGLAPLAGAEGGPPGLVSWGCQTLVLAPGEATTLQVTFANLPLRRFTLLVESGGTTCDVNVRRDVDGSLLYDLRNEVRHQLDVPWGVGESLTAVLTAGPAGGSYAVSFWGPSATDHKRAYSFHVNRALESHAAGDLDAFRYHCRAALQQDPADTVAALLLRGLDGAGRPTGLAAPDSTGVRRGEAAALVATGRLYEALAVLDAAFAAAPDAATAALVLSDLGALRIALGNPVQARASYEAARELGLPPDLDAAAAAALEQLPVFER
jgi:hypothetical protein